MSWILVDSFLVVGIEVASEETEVLELDMEAEMVEDFVELSLVLVLGKAWGPLVDYFLVNQSFLSVYGLLLVNGAFSGYNSVFHWVKTSVMPFLALTRI